MKHDDHHHTKKCHKHCHCETPSSTSRPSRDEEHQSDTASSQDKIDHSYEDQQKKDEATLAHDAVREVDQLKKDATEFKDKYLRALAEIENSRKRLTKDKIEAQGFAIQNVIIDLLQPFDQMEMALQHADKASNEVKAWATGFQMILEQFRQVFSNHNVIAFQSVGTAFDPHLHEAIETEKTSEHPEGIVLFEFQKGYKMGTKTIRPAKVRVAAAIKEDDTTNYGTIEDSSDSDDNNGNAAAASSSSCSC